MSRVYMNGFEHKSMVGVAGCGDYGNSCSWSSPPRGGVGLKMTCGGSHGVEWSYTFPEAISDSDIYVRIFYKVHIDGGNIVKSRLRFRDENSDLFFGFNTYDDEVRIRDGDDTLVYSETVGYNFGEYRMEFHFTSSHVDIRRDGTLWQSLDGTFASTLGSLKARMIEDSSTGNGGFITMDEIAINTGAGDRNNGWPGNGHIVGLKPNAVGSKSEMDPYPGTGEDNYEDVDDDGPDGDDTYVDGGPGETDLYGIEDLADPDTKQVKAVAVHAYTKLTEVGNAGIEPVVERDGSEVEGDDYDLTGELDYMLATMILEDDPITSAAWDSEDLNHSEFGIKAVST
jgi:hypothetical protein